MKTHAAFLLVTFVAAAILSDVPRARRSGDALAAVQEVTISVTNNSFFTYTIDGADNPTLMLTRGETYVFEIDAFGHPFYIKTARTIGEGDQYNAGVSEQGLSGGQITWTIPANAPSPLFYQCGVHSSMGGTIELQGPVGVPGNEGLGRLWLGPAVPNPARDGVLFRFSLPRTGFFRLAVYDARGRQVRVVANEYAWAGAHALRWDGRDEAGRPVASGVYSFQLTAGTERLARRVALMK